jgi:FkbM family methyltransferase
MTKSYTVNFYAALMRVRPAQLCDVLKKILRVRRRHVRSATGQTFWLDPVSVLGLHLMSEGLHEPQMCKLFKLIVRPGDCVIDVGGNEGYFSVLAASLVQDGRVHCIEPQDRLQDILRENIRINQAQAVVVHQLALADTTESLRLYLRPSTNTGASSLYRHWKLGSKCVPIQATTLDEFFVAHGLTRVRLMKVDCEGAEHLIISGGRRVLTERAIDFIALEYHPIICGTGKCAEVHTALAAAGYSLAKIGEQCIYHLPGLEGALAPLGELRTGCSWN